jgi:hypothetical protein
MLAYTLQLMEEGPRKTIQKNSVLDIYLLCSDFVMMEFVVCYFAFLYYAALPPKIYPQYRFPFTPLFG